MTTTTDSHSQSVGRSVLLYVETKPYVSLVLRSFLSLSLSLSLSVFLSFLLLFLHLPCFWVNLIDVGDPLVPLHYAYDSLQGDIGRHRGS